jgi:ABC-2 type transport system permease protein
MRLVVASEWVKLRRKGMLAALGGVIAVTVLGTIITILTVNSSTSTKTSGGGPFGGKTSISFAQMASSHGLADALGNSGTLLGVIIMGVVAASVAGEFSTGTLRNLLLREPRRARLLLGKLLGLGSAISLAVVVAAVFAAVAAVIAASGKGLPIHAWGSGSGVGAALGSVTELILATLG